VGLSSVNYGLRFWKWELCLGWLAVRDEAPGLSRRRSALIYLAGLSMSVTPGKIGEVLRSVLLRASDGVPVARTAPVVVADRLTDVVALSVLALVGTLEHREYLPVVVASLVLVMLGVVVLGSPRALRTVLTALGHLPGARALAANATSLADSSAVVLRWHRLAVLSVISVLGWGLECVGYWMVLHGFAGVDASLALCTFLWSVTTLIGALSFLPGGLGATEGTLAVLVTRLATGLTAASAVASTLLIRLATLWYGELVGAAALALFLRDPQVRERAAAAEDERAS
jgi:uncharacterized membrane protein YbhN (UPF0104 family)